MENKKKHQETSIKDRESSIQHQESSITAQLITALLETYQPTDTTEGAELKTSIDLMEDMATIADVEKEEIAAAMQKAKFKLEYNDAGVFWVMKKR